jgi:putative transposase
MMPMAAVFSPADLKVAFESRFHFGWYAHGVQPTLESIGVVIEKAFPEVALRRNYHILEYDLQPSVLRALLSLAPADSPADVTRYVKGNISAAARKERRASELWSRGWFLRSVGHVTNDTVRKYVVEQFEHHRSAPLALPTAAVKAGYQHPGDPNALRASSHAKFEYNVHLVFTTNHRREILDLQVAEALVGYFREACEKSSWIPWNVQVVWNHAHMFLGLSPRDAPGQVAVGLLNGSEHFLQHRYGRAFRDVVDSTIWQPGYYVATVGSATTAQVKSYLSAKDSAF